MSRHLVHISLTARDTAARLTEQPPVFFEATRPETHAITIDPRKRFQKMEGFGVWSFKHLAGAAAPFSKYRVLA